MLQVFRLILHVFRVMLHMFLVMLHVFRVMLQVFRVMLHVFHVMLQVSCNVARVSGNVAGVSCNVARVSRTLLLQDVRRLSVTRYYCVETAKLVTRQPQVERRTAKVRQTLRTPRDTRFLCESRTLYFTYWACTNKSVK